MRASTQGAQVNLGKRKRRAERAWNVPFYSLLFLRLYLNGQLVATGADASQLPTGLRVIVGQLDESRLERPFTGQLDELAVYPRALDAETLQRHYDMARLRATQAIVARDEEI